MSKGEDLLVTRVVLTGAIPERCHLEGELCRNAVAAECTVGRIVLEEGILEAEAARLFEIVLKAGCVGMGVECGFLVDGQPAQTKDEVAKTVGARVKELVELDMVDGLIDSDELLGKPENPIETALSNL